MVPPWFLICAARASTSVRYVFDPPCGSVYT